MSESEDVCQACGAKTVRYKHSLSKGLAGALASLYRKAGLHPCRISDIGLTHTQVANFQKLKYWGLAATMTKRDNSGFWIVTVLGSQWLRGLKAVPKSVWTYRGNPQPVQSGPGDLNPLVMVKDLLPGWELRSDYARGAQPKDDGEQPSLFSEGSQ